MNYTMEDLFQILMLVVCLVGRINGDEERPFLINCGTNSSTTVHGRTWDGDFSSDGISNLTLSYPGIVASTVSIDDDSIYAPLYKTARIFPAASNYTFKGVQANRSYFLRLHFSPFSYEKYDVNSCSFGVFVNGLVLIYRFNPVVEISSKNSNSSALVKEYLLPTSSDGFLVEFVPTRDSFAFVNAIELVPVPENLFEEYVSRVGGNGAKDFLNLRKRGMETIYRLNVGGPIVQADQDSRLWRTWFKDSEYMIMADAGLGISDHSVVNDNSSNVTLFAPLLVYETARSMSNAEVLEKRFNMSWKFRVDPSFDYLVRLHFCELEYDKPNERVFRIYINKMTAVDNFDIVKQAGGKGKPHHIDFSDMTSARVESLWIQLGTNLAAGAARSDALLNGLEVFKLSHNGNFVSGLNRFGLEQRNSKKKYGRILVAGMIAGIASIMILTLASILIYLFIEFRKRQLKNTKKSSSAAITYANANEQLTSAIQNQNGSQSSHRTGRAFSLAEIRTATNDFEENLVIGAGGFGKVYKGETEDGTIVAIKRAKFQSQQGLREFETEIEMLSKVRHRHLVAMIGFCEEKNEMILVYEYMANGTLRSHLYGTDLPPLSWKQRLEICIGAARGLHYLHTGADGGIIHRDVKTTNILLDENFVPKMSDFGLSKTGPALDQTHVSTAVKGSFGYLDPEYFRRQQLTEKSDVYSFGVVLFEVICARAIINPSLPKEQINLAEWAMRWQRQKSLETIIDQCLREKCCLESIIRYGEIAERCLADEGKNRPTMGEVLWHLEYALQLHTSWLQANTELGEQKCYRNPTPGNLGRRRCIEVGEPSTRRKEEYGKEGRLLHFEMQGQFAVQSHDLHEDKSMSRPYET